MNNMDSSQNDISISTKNLCKSFGKFKAVDRITFDVKKGEIFGFLGANGAGKTTAMRMLCGLSFPTSGEGRVAGYDIYKDNEKIKRNIGYMSQKFSLYHDLNIIENIELFGGIYGMKSQEIKTKTKQILERLKMEKESHKKISELPLGWKQKLAFSVALFHNPQIIFLDEPTGGVDPITRREFWKMIYEASETGTTVFVTTHYMDEAEYCQRVSIMVDGQISALDTPSNLRKQYKAKTMNDVFLKLARNSSRT